MCRIGFSVSLPEIIRYKINPFEFFEAAEHAGLCPPLIQACWGDICPEQRRVNQFEPIEHLMELANTRFKNIILQLGFRSQRSSFSIPKEYQQFFAPQPGSSVLHGKVIEPAAYFREYLLGTCLRLQERFNITELLLEEGCFDYFDFDFPRDVSIHAEILGAELQWLIEQGVRLPAATSMSLYADYTPSQLETLEELLANNFTKKLVSLFNGFGINCFPWVKGRRYRDCHWRIIDTVAELVTRAGKQLIFTKVQFEPFGEPPEPDRPTPQEALENACALMERYPKAIFFLFGLERAFAQLKQGDTSWWDAALQLLE